MLSSELIFSEGNNRKALVTAHVTLYFSRLDGLANGLSAALGIVFPLLMPHIRWYRTENMTRDRKVTQKLIDSVTSWFGPRFPEREEYGLILSSGETSEDVGPWGFEFGVEPDLMDVESGYFHVNLPVEVLKNTPDMLVDLTTSLAESLDFRSGHAGYGVNYEEGEIIPSRDDQLRAWYNRYQALDARDLALTGGAFHDRVKGAGWLTLLDLDLMQKLGGIKMIEAKLPPEVTIKQLKHGLLIQAGKRPSLGDKNRHEKLTELRAVNDLLKPIRIEEDILISAFDDADQTRSWIERLDQK